MQSLRIFFSVLLAFLFTEGNAQSPIIQFFNPKSTTVDETVEIVGSNFGTDKTVIRVFFGSAKALVQKVTDDKIHVTVPAGASYDKITVINTSTGLSASSTDSFLLSYSGNGLNSANFLAQVDFPGDLGLYHHTIGDFDLDGKNDAAMVNLQTNSISVLKNLSSLAAIDFAPKQNFNLGVPATNIVSADLDGDGKLDLIVSQYPTADGYANKVMVLRNTSITATGSEAINFAAPQEFLVDGNNAKNVVVQDLNADGKPEVLISNEANNIISILKNESTIGSIKFNSTIQKVSVANVKQCSGLAIGDLNSDGKPEIVVTTYLGSNVYIFPNISAPGSIDFAPNQVIFVSGNIINVAVGDLNGDNKQDIVVTKILSGNVSVVLNKTVSPGGEIIMSETSKDFITAPQPWGIDIGDLDGDGKPDLAIASVSDSKLVTVLRNTTGIDGELSFASKLDLKTKEPSRSVKIVDINGDGKPDITITSINTAKLSVIRNKHCIVPKVSPAGPLTLCPGQTVTLKAQKGIGITYQWKKNNVDIAGATGNSLTLAASDDGDYKVLVNGESGSCSYASNNVTIAASSGLVPSITSIGNSGPVCEGEKVTLTASSQSGASYAWSGPNGFTSNLQNPVIENFNASMVGNYYLTVKVGACSSEPDTTNVLLNTSTAVATIVTSSPIICEGGSTELKVSEGTGNTYKWKKNGAYINGATSSVFVANEPGNYSVEVASTAGCKATSKELTLKKIDKVTADFTMPLTSCTNTPISLVNKTQVSTNLAVAYNWTFGNGNSSTQQNPPSNSVIYTAKGTYKVKLKVTVEGVCISEIEKSITISDNFTVEIASNFPGNAFCRGEGVTLTAPEGYNLYRWKKNGSEVIAELTTPDIRVNEAAAYSVEVQRDGCSGMGSITLMALDKPEVTAAITGEATVVVPGDSVQLSASGADTYTWFPTEGLDNPLIPTPKAAPIVNTIYSVVGINSEGCADTAQVEVIVTKDLLVTPYNVLTPNGDQKNDFWKIQGIEKYPDCKVAIMNRQGQLIFEAQPYLNDWDGTFNGKKLPEGAYFYVIQCVESGEGKTGSVTLVR